MINEVQILARYFGIVKQQ